MELTTKEKITNAIRNYKADGCNNGIDCYMEFKTRKATDFCFGYFNTYAQILDSTSLEENKMFFYVDGWVELDFFCKQVGFDNIADFDCTFREEF